MEKFTEEVIEIIGMIPYGKVMTYGQIAFCAGSPKGARQVSRILHSCSLKHSLPWHKVVNSKGEISFTKEKARREQKTLLEKEGVKFSQNCKIDLEQFSFKPFSNM